MPSTKSAKKYTRVTTRKTSFNNMRKSAFRNTTKNVHQLIKEKKFDEAKKAFKKAQKALDKAAKTGVIKKGTAARKKSRLVKLLKK